MTAAAGYDGMETTYDDAGRKTEEYFVDGSGKLVDSERGYAKMTHVYDENTGWEIETRYFNSAEEPVMVSGAARIEYEYDKDGNKSVTRKYDAADELIQDADGVAYTFIEYDAWKRPVKETFMDENGEPLFAASKGYAVTTKEYDHTINIVLQRYFDTQENPVNLPAGYAAVHTDYDQTNKPSRVDYLNTNGDPSSPADVKAGYSSIAYERDDRGNITLESYYDQGGEPIAAKAGYAAFRKEYNDLNKVTKTEYLDTDGNLVAIANGTAVVLNEYDEKGNMVKESYLDEDGDTHSIQPTGKYDPKTYYSYAEIRKEYNEQNKMTEQSYYDAEGDRAKCAQQYSIQRFEYDNLGRQILTAWFTVSEEPYVNKDGYASMVTTYAPDGSKTDTYYNANGDEVTVNTK